MKPTYDFHFVDTIYSHFSDEVLANIAVDLLRVFQSANFKGLNATYYPKDHIFASDRYMGDTCVKARPGSVSINFFKAVTQGWACDQMYDAETLIDEILYRAKGKGIVFNQDVGLTQVLGQEIKELTNKLCTPVALSADELIHNSHQTCEALRI